MLYKYPNITIRQKHYLGHIKITQGKLRSVCIYEEMAKLVLVVRHMMNKKNKNWHASQL